TTGDQGERTRAVYCRSDDERVGRGLGLDTIDVYSYIPAISSIDTDSVDEGQVVSLAGKIGGVDNVLNEAVDQILKSQADDLERQRRRSFRRVHLHQLDGWLHQIEDMLEE